jgi:nicotinamidase-related amidase
MKDLQPHDRVALLINECQLGLLDPQHAVFPAIYSQATERGIVPKIAALADAFRQAGQPVIYINMEHRADYAGVSINHAVVAYVVKIGGLREGTPSVAVVPELAPQACDHVVRRYSGMTAFYGNHLDQLLRNLNITTVVPAGVSTDVAVPGMVLGALDRGFRVVIAEDCIAGTSAQVQDVMVHKIFPSLATVTTSEKIIAALSAPGSARGLAAP